MLSTSIIGYHANDMPRCSAFIAPGASYLCKSDSDTEYLGSGMYFWTSNSDARWWASGRINRGKYPTALIVKAEIDITHSWDIDENDEDIEQIQSLWNQIDEKQRMRGYLGKNKIKMTGAMFEIIFKMFPNVSEVVEVIIGRRGYLRKDKTITFFDNSHFQYRVRTILCVRYHRAISNRERVEEWPATS